MHFAFLETDGTDSRWFFHNEPGCKILRLIDQHLNLLSPREVLGDGWWVGASEVEGSLQINHYRYKKGDPLHSKKASKRATNQVTKMEKNTRTRWRSPNHPNHLCPSMSRMFAHLHPSMFTAGWSNRPADAVHPRLHGSIQRPGSRTPTWGLKIRYTKLQPTSSVSAVDWFMAQLQLSISVKSHYCKCFTPVFGG